jgi:protocatechuate 3,4-dioxygenase alpha subunit
MSLYATGSQTVGPYLHIGLDWLNTSDLVGNAASVDGKIVIEGCIFDGNGAPVTDAAVELWQANRHGRYAHPGDKRALALEPGFRGFGRMPTDAKGMFRFTTIKPGRVPGRDGAMQAPHIAVTVFARGLLKHLVTRIYFPDGEGNADDAVLNAVPPDRRDTLVARPVPNRAGVFEWNIVLQGEANGQGETVFFDI